jgi:hypothetical protein
MQLENPEHLDNSYPEHLTNLSAFRRLIVRLEAEWPAFLDKRKLRLMQAERNGSAAEKVAEDILSDFFTSVLDWSIGDLNNQLHYADIVLTQLGIKKLLIEVKRPGSIDWNQASFNQALRQARKYADEQNVSTIAISDGRIFYAADIVNGGLKDRACLYLDSEVFLPNSWWISADGIYRDPEDLGPQIFKPFGPQGTSLTNINEEDSSILIHPKYKVPVECFAYAGDASKPATWKLPYRNSDGSVDEKHLPGAIRAVVSNYRGTRVSTIPERAVPDVLFRLGQAALEIKKLPSQTPTPLQTYQQLHDALVQLGLLNKLQKHENYN